MKHPDIDILQQYADGMLAAAERDGVERHLASCASCRSAMQLERSLSESLRTIPSPSPSSRFDARVLAAVRRPASRSAGRTLWLRYAAAAILIVTTTVVIVIAGASGEAQSRTVLTPVFERITEVIAPALDLVSSQGQQLTPRLDDRDSDFFRIFFLATAALLIIGGLERFIFPSLRHGPRH